jgi:hypothetical protein
MSYSGPLLPLKLDWRRMPVAAAVFTACGMGGARWLSPLCSSLPAEVDSINERSPFERDCEETHTWYSTSE